MQPLDGIKVLELASVWAMPGAAMYLADQGADVIKIEPPEGDIGRTVAMSPPIKGLSRAFWSLNRNKRSLCLDLKQTAGIEVLHDLVRDADVLIHNYRPSAEAKLGVDYSTLDAINPRLIYAGFNAFGTEGERSGARGYDLTVQAASGVSMRRPKPDGQPQTMSIYAIDMASSIMVGYAVCLALIQRGRTGLGQRISGSLLQTALALQLPDAVKVAGFEEPEDSPTALDDAPFSAYPCADGLYIQLSIASDREWRNIGLGLGLDAAIVERFANSETRSAASDELKAILGAAFASRPAREWQVALDASDGPAVVVETPDTLFDSTQIRANGGFIDIEQPGIGTATVVNTPFRMSGAQPPEMRPAPDLGEHTRAVLESLGYDAGQIQRLYDGRVVR